MRSTCVPSPFAHIGKAINWQIFPDSTTCVRHITWAKSRGPQGEREREKSIDNSRQHSSKVTDSARGCTVQSNMARSTSQNQSQAPFTKPTITINPIVLQPIPQPPKLFSSSCHQKQPLHHQGLFRHEQHLRAGGYYHTYTPGLETFFRTHK